MYSHRARQVGFLVLSGSVVVESRGHQWCDLGIEKLEDQAMALNWNRRGS
jgi:hypothetical protein